MPPPLPLLCFADDTTGSYSAHDISNLFSTMNIELEAINQWFRANKLCLNVNKTKYIVFRPTATHIQTENNKYKNK